jgi:uncharacterized membrane protein YgdD (TMEM256/DUF423 family)
MQVRGLGTSMSIAFATISGIYLVALVVMMLLGHTDPAVEPYATLFHLLNLVAPLVAIPIWCGIYLAAPTKKKVYSLTSLAFAVMWAIVVVINRFVALTMVRQSANAGRTDGLEWFLPYGWPSFTRAIEMLGWGVFFALACLFLVPVFTTGRLERAIAGVFAITGVLSFVGGTVAVAVDSTTLMGLVAPIGWGLGPIAGAVLLAAWFGSSTRLDAPDVPAKLA